ncbi:hypothetical protein NQZ68_004274 [Dissostichus eleginoides]|nr:hypothetical protein NQZ68_004274 [Dissostichus eleginoides]
MSQSPTYQRDSASSSPESPKEGDFSPRQHYDNLKSLEEQETCDNQRDPIVNIITDNYSSSLLNAQICAPLAANDLGKLCAGTLPQEQLKKSSPELMEVLSLDGRFITLVGAQTQTDWEWVEQSLFFSCQVQKETENPPLLQAEVVNMDAVAESSEEPGDEKMAEIEHNIPSVGLPRLIAYKPEPKQTPHVGKELAQKESARKIDVNPHAPVMSEEKREAAKKQAKERLNLTPGGGLCFSETGALRRRWNWLYGDPHVRNLPFKPLTFALAPHISVRIHSQERVSITFAHKQNRVHFNVGSKLISPESHDKLGQDVLERYIQMKSSEIHSLLGQMQTFMSHHSARLRNIKPHYSFIDQAQRLSRQMEKEESPEEIKAHVN